MPFKQTYREGPHPLRAIALVIQRTFDN